KKLSSNTNLMEDLIYLMCFSVDGSKHFSIKSTKKLGFNGCAQNSQIRFLPLICDLYFNFFIDGTCPKCEEGWELHRGNCYYFSTNKSTWNQSRDDCRSKGGDLVKIDSREELKQNMNKDDDSFWIGLTDSKEEGKWLWVDDSPLNTRGADDLKCWHDVPCIISLKSICEKSV
uniref:C-type lectin domain-containing protein n=1 Tax=Anabas testudineus TaxID=64144 RepID=A0A3Q1HED7_ANATE